MTAVLDSLSQIMETFGAAIVVPIVLFFICLIMKVSPKKATQSALNAGIGLIGFNFLISAYTPVVTPVIQRMVDTTGVNLNMIDTGWQATSVVAYSTQVGMIFLGFGLLLQTLLFVFKVYNIFMPSDLWNNYSFMLWGSMIFLVTGNLWLALLLMTVQNLYTLAINEVLAKRWATYYGYPGTTMTAPHDVASVPLALLMYFFLTKLGANKIKLDPEYLQAKMGFLGEPSSLGFVLGLILGLAGNFTRITTLEAWGEITLVGVATAAIMAIFPRIAGIFASAFTAITDHSKKSTKSSEEDEREWYFAINDAAGYGEPATLLSGMILIPIIIILAIILPGNQALPMVDLIAIPYLLQGIVPFVNGNIFKTIIIGGTYLTCALYLITRVAPIFTEVAISVGVDLPSGAVMIFSLLVVGNLLFGSLFLIFLTQNPFLIGATIVLYILLYSYIRKNRAKIEAYVERQALASTAESETGDFR